MRHDHQHSDGEEHRHGEARISTAEERALLEPFTDDVHAFLRVALDGVDGPIAEIGAGDGVIADRLRADGFDVTAVDANPATAAAATGQGREVLAADWRTWDGAGRAPFAALVFTRSLHHIDPIEHATEQMVRLAPGGRLICDEFGFERVDEAGAQLLVDARAIAAAAGVSDKDVVAVADPTAAWTDRMAGNHHVLPSDRLLGAIREVADIEQLAHGRFIARFVAQGLDPTHPRAHAVRDLLIATEDARIAAGGLAPAGLRLVARIRSSA